MITGILDTAILIDFLRGYSRAVQWLSSNPDIAITPIVKFEILDGAANVKELRHSLKMLKQFQMVDLMPDDIEWALTQFTLYKLSHNVGSMDCLIASTAFRLQVPLYTRNLKHFAPMLGGLAQQPY